MFTFTDSADVEVSSILAANCSFVAELSEEASEVKKQIDKFIKKEPEAVAMLLKTWIEDMN